jgi:hypothetical protein
MSALGRKPTLALRCHDWDTYSKDLAGRVSRREEIPCQEKGEEFEEEAHRVLAILEPLRDAAMMAARAAATLAKAVAPVPAPRTRAGWRCIRENWAVNAVPARIDVGIRAAGSRFANYDVRGRPRRGRKGRRKRQQSNENYAR